MEKLSENTENSFQWITNKKNYTYYLVTYNTYIFCGIRGK